MPASSNFNDYSVAWIAPLPVEAKVAYALMKKPTVVLTSEKVDDYVYIGGEISGHKVVLATLPAGTNYGPGAAASLVNQVKLRFPNLWFALLVGVAAGLPNLMPKHGQKVRDIRLGDVLVCVPDKKDVGVHHYDLGTDDGENFVPSGRQAESPSLVRSAISTIALMEKHPFKKGEKFAEELESLLSALEDDPDGDSFTCPSQTSDQLYIYTYEQDKIVSKLAERTPRDESERTKVFRGSIGSGGTLMRNHKRRDMLRDEHNLIGLEMEAAGVMNTLPTGMIRGVCDYGDNFKNKEWQPYAAAVAAVYAKGVLDVVQAKS